MAETFLPNPNDRKPHLKTQEPQLKHISKDILDIQVDRKVYEKNYLPSAFYPLLIQFTDLFIEIVCLHLPLPNDEIFTNSLRAGYLPFIALSIPMWNTLMKDPTSRSQINKFFRRPYNNPFVINDKDLGYTAYHLVYKGDTEEDRLGVDLQSGDNIIYFATPEIMSPESDSEMNDYELSLWSDLYEISIRELKEKIKEKDYRAVCLEFPPNIHDAITKSFQRKPSIEQSALLQGKSVEPQDPDRQTVILSREEFENLTLTPQEAFQQIVDELEDDQLNRLVELAKGAKNQEELKLITTLLQGRISQIINDQIAAHFNGSETVRTRTGEFHDPARERYERFTSLTPRANGNMDVQMVSQPGRSPYADMARGNRKIETQSLQRLLHMQNEPIETIIGSSSPYRQAQLALLLHELLKESSIGELTRERILDKDKLLAELQRYKHVINSQRGDHSIAKGIKVPWMKRRGGSLLASLMLYSATRLGLPLIDNQQQIQDMIKPQSYIEDYHRPSFKEALPLAGLDWKIEAYDMSEAGYYIESTSHEFKDGNWIMNTTRQNEYTYPRHYQNQDPRLNLLRRIPRSTAGETRFKVPIKDGTSVAAINITNGQGSEISFQTHILTDRTVEIVIVGGRINPADLFDINVTLIPGSQGQIQATTPLSPLNLRELNQNAQRMIETAAENPQQPFEQTVAHAVTQTHSYSISPEGKEKLAQAQTAEEVVNAVESVSGCDCDTCNTQAVLLSANDTDNSLFMNIAYGYINSGNNPSSPQIQSSLRKENRHAFGITNEGSIIDATALEPAEDPLTQEYLKLLEGNESGENEWEKQNKDIADLVKRQRELQTNIALFTGILASVPSYLMIRQSSKLLKRLTSADNLELLSDKIISGIFSDAELTKAFHFITWLSWGNLNSTPHLNQPLSSEDPMATIKNLKENTHIEKIQEYLEHPARFEKNNNLSIVERMKLRMLASYLSRGIQ